MPLKINQIKRCFSKIMSSITREVSFGNATDYLALWSYVSWQHDAVYVGSGIFLRNAAFVKVTLAKISGSAW